MAPEFFVPADSPHLGGYIVGGDEATWYPALWRYLILNEGVSSVVDVGCGEGHALHFLVSHGASGVGVDGVPQRHPDPRVRIFPHDYTRGPFEISWHEAAGYGDLSDCFDDERDLRRAEFDLAWCCEFVEHIEERHIPNFVATFRQARLVLMTHAFPGQPGHHHVNCQTSDYWVGVMAAAGFSVDRPLTATARELARRNDNPWNHFARSGLAFRRNT